mmetsp:Transcript_10759/g.14761  ORF Transcript_10759/g.14761 Transcript_10759/m.14761 type:complete len:457 (+) Transcript_10759:1329-2699(+)
MGRKVFIEESAFAQYNERLQSSSFSEVGLLVGQMSPSRDLVIGLVPTPAQNTEQDVIKSMGVQDIDEQWVAEHAKQLANLLPGGLFIVGIFIIAPTEALKNKDAQIQQMVFGVSKTRNTKLQPSDSIYLHVCSRTKKMTCKSFDTTKGSSSSAWPADVKTQSFMDTIHYFHGEYSFDVDISVNTLDTKRLGEHIEQQLAVIEAQIDSAVLSVDGKILPQNTETDTPESIEKYLKVSGKKVSVDHVVQCWTQFGETSQSEQFSASSFVKIEGVATSLSLISLKEDIGTAIKMIKADMYNSVRHRFNLLFDELQQGSDGSPFQQAHCPTNDTLWILPKRVYIKSPWGLYLSDYMFPSETPQDCQTRVMELARVAPAQSIEWIWNKEEFPPEKNEFYASKTKSRIIKSQHKPPSKPAQVYNSGTSQTVQKAEPQQSYSLVALVSVLILLIAVYFAAFHS